MANVRWVAALGVMVLSGCNSAPAALTGQPEMMAVTPVMLNASDGLTVWGRYYRATHPKALILLFHQAGSSKDEYATIAPRLVEAGYSALAIDQRSGGGLFGRNETAARAKGKPGYLDARRDLDAAVDWAGPMGVPVILWGSSYSAALVFLVAADHPGQAAAILSFSPGEYLGEGDPVTKAAALVKVPVFVTAAKEPGEAAAAKAIFNVVPARTKVFVVPANAGAHGSSTLIAAKNPQGAEDNWQAVLAFLKSVAP